MVQIRVRLFAGDKQPPVEFVRRDTGLTVPADGKRYGIVLPDYESIEYDYQPRQIAGGNTFPDYAVPATEKGRPKFEGQNYEYINLPPVWHGWLHGLFDHVTEGRLPRGKIEYFYTEKIIDKVKVETRIPWEERERYDKYGTIYAKFTPGSLMFAYGDFIKISRAITDGHPVERNRFDAVTNRNPGQDPYQWNCAIVLRNNLVRLLGTDDKYWAVETYNFSKSPPTYEQALQEPWRLHWATEQTTVKLPNGTWVISGWPQLEACLDLLPPYNFPKLGTPYPYGTRDGISYIEKRSIKLVDNGARYSPYNLPIY